MRGEVFKVEKENCFGGVFVSMIMYPNYPDLGLTYNKMVYHDAEVVKGYGRLWLNQLVGQVVEL